MALFQLLLAAQLLNIVQCATPVNVIVQWSEVAMTSARSAKLSSPSQARVLAMNNLAMLQALYNLGCQQKSSSCTPAAATMSASTAAHRVLSSIFIADIPLFDSTLLAIANAAGSDQKAAILAGSDAGHRAGLSVIKSRSNDGSTTFEPYEIQNKTGLWVPTPPDYIRTPVAPNYGHVKPFLIKDIWSMLPGGVPNFDSAEYKKDWNDVFWYGNINCPNRTADQTEQALFWNEDGIWHSAAKEVLASKKSPDDLMGYAVAFMLLNVARANAGIACYATKYKYNTWRPVTAFRQGVPSVPSLVTDPTWTPLLQTPVFPEYVSAHSSFSAASARILALIIRADDISFCAQAVTGNRKPRCFAGLRAAAEDAGQSRIYGGIHFQFANRDGLELGEEVADATYDEWRLNGIPSSAASSKTSVALVVIAPSLSCMLIGSRRLTKAGF